MSLDLLAIHDQLISWPRPSVNQAVGLCRPLPAPFFSLRNRAACLGPIQMYGAGTFSMAEITEHALTDLSGTQHDSVHGKPLEKGDGIASLEEAMDIARTFETTKAPVAEFQSYGSSSLSSATVHGLRRETAHEEWIFHCGAL